MDYINKVIEGDCISVMADMPSDSIAACITDPPYNYEFIGREWNNSEIPAKAKQSKR